MSCSTVTRQSFSWAPRAVVGSAVFAALAISGCGGKGGQGDGTGMSCSSDLTISGIEHVDSKGLCVDDDTLFGCPEKLLTEWPHTETPVKYIRLFKVFRPDDPEELTLRVHENIVTYVKANGIKVLVGTILTCEDDVDEKDWNYVQKLLQALGKEHVLALAVGNEINQWKPDKLKDDACLNKMWGGELLTQMQSRIKWARDTLGNPELPVTSVFSGQILWPTVGSTGIAFENSDGNKVEDFFKAVYESGEKNFVFALNYYPIFDGSNADRTCEKACEVSNCFNKEGQGDTTCLTTFQLVRTRELMSKFFAHNSQFGVSTAPLWIGEIGWSSPWEGDHPMAKCDNFFSPHMLYLYYKNFLQWDMQFKDGVDPPDMAFYFTMRDSSQYGKREHFGLLESCDASSCKLTDADSKGFVPTPAPSPSPVPEPASGPCCAEGAATDTLLCCQDTRGCCDPSAAQPLNCCTTAAAASYSNATIML